MPDSHSFATSPIHRPNVRQRGAPRFAPDGVTPLGDGVVGEPDNDEFDPSAHTVDAVKAYVTEHPDYVTEILEAEEAGKARVTLVEWLDNFGK